MVQSALGGNRARLWEPSRFCFPTIVVNLLLRAKVSSYFNVNDNIIGAVLG
jgi:hypothetical protein